MNGFLFIIPAVVFLIMSVFTLSDYGINWDEPYHFQRGQAYLNYFFTGNKDFSNLHPYPYLSEECINNRYGCDSPPGGPSDFLVNRKSEIYETEIAKRQSNHRTKRSTFQSNYYTFDYFMANDGAGHPPLNDIFAALYNYVFYQKFHLLGDIEAYHLFEITTVFTLILTVGIFTYYEFGWIAATVSSTVLAMYPLVFSEAHFNIKDPVQMSFFGISLILFYFGVIKSQWSKIIFSAIFTGLALGTKFNIIFLPFIVVPWLILYLKGKPKNFKFIFVFIIYPIISLGLVYVMWPFLWSNPVQNFKTVASFYWTNGVTLLPEVDKFIIHGLNFFPVTWITFTTPLPVLVFATFGVLISLTQLIKHQKIVYLLVLLWCGLPILRVSLPHTAIHSGIRHIMEFIPALAILTGIGVSKIFKKQYLWVLLPTVIFMAWELIRLHPNENVYFNQLAGGLSGAVVKDLPYWGYSYGNTYLQGVRWLNTHAESNSKLTLLLGAVVNVPRIKLRADIELNNKYWSGPAKLGEYAIEMSHNYSQKDYFRYAYYETFLDPIYQVKVDGVSILKVWKNDLEHTKPVLRSEVSYQPFSQKIENGKLFLDLGEDRILTKIRIEHGNQDCQKQKEGYILTSLDEKNWNREPDLIDAPQSQVEADPTKFGYTDNNFIFFFTLRQARYIIVNADMPNSCLLRSPQVTVRYLEKI